MTDLSDINMEGVQPMGETQELAIGQYLVRIEDSEKKEAKEKYDGNNEKLPTGHYLQLAQRVYGGPNDGHVEFSRLNLWHYKDTTVRIAKRELKSIQDATNVHPVKGEDGVTRFKSEWLHNHWMILEVRPNSQDPKKTVKLYHPAPADIVAEFKHVPPVQTTTPEAAPAASASTPAYLRNVQPPAPIQAPAAPTQPAAGALPSWAAKKAG